MPARPTKTGPNPAVAPPAARAAGAAHTQALSRGLAVLDALAATEGGATLTALAQALDLPAPTAHRLLATLAEAGYVTQGDGGLWRVGVRAFRAGSAFLLHRNLVAQAYPFLQRLMDDAGETTNLAVVDEGDAVFVEQVQCRELMRMNARLGARAPLHASGVGKAMLSALDPAGVRAATARRGLVRYTPHTITTLPRSTPSSPRSASAATRSTPKSTRWACPASRRRCSTSMGRRGPRCRWRDRRRGCRRRGWRTSDRRCVPPPMR